MDKTISNLEMELAAARAAHESIRSGSPLSEELKNAESSGKRRYLMVVGINTAFSSRRRRDSVRTTWMPQGWNSNFLFNTPPPSFLWFVEILHYPCGFINLSSQKHEIRWEKKEAGGRERHYHSLRHWS